jgi:hypothetical protein
VAGQSSSTIAYQAESRMESGNTNVLAEDSLERRTDAEEGAPDAQVSSVGLELDAHRAASRKPSR